MLTLHVRQVPRHIGDGQKRATVHYHVLSLFTPYFSKQSQLKTSNHPGGLDTITDATVEKFLLSQACLLELMDTLSRWLNTSVETMKVLKPMLLLRFLAPCSLLFPHLRGGLRQSNMVFETLETLRQMPRLSHPAFVGHAYYLLKNFKAIEYGLIAREAENVCTTLHPSGELSMTDYSGYSTRW